ncbi:MAG: hypothetical protein U1D30_14855 [Planctomycetota bacterium]
MARPFNDLQEPMEAFDEFLEVWERPMETPRRTTRTIAVHVAHPQNAVEVETTRKYGNEGGVQVAVTVHDGEFQRREEVRAALDAAVGEFEADMEAKEAALR